MNSHVTLYWKEIKNMSRELLVILAVQIGYVVLLTFMFSSHVPNPTQFERFILNLGDFLLYIFPALLVYSLYMEERTGTFYQAHSLPVKRCILLRTKFLAVLSALLLTMSLIFTYSFIYNTLYPLVDTWVFLDGLLESFCIPFIGLCLVTSAWGIIQPFKRNRLVLGLMAVAAGSGVYVRVVKILPDYGLSALERLSGEFFLTLGTGSIFAFIGLFLYEKYAEV